eukprot:NODE_254_length_12812_cov_0.286872.p10 type:complete len:117 gc:universal NODE_254_length_12812_cov_0.286872:12002-12352(+)
MEQQRPEGQSRVALHVKSVEVGLAAAVVVVALTVVVAALTVVVAALAVVAVLSPVDVAGHCLEQFAPLQYASVVPQYPCMEQQRPEGQSSFELHVPSVEIGLVGVVVPQYSAVLPQ